MRPIYYIIGIDLVILIVSIKYIFKSYEIFAKSLAEHFFPDELFPNPLEKFAEQNDSRHKMNILYAVALFLAVSTFLIYIFLLR